MDELDIKKLVANILLGRGGAEIQLESRHLVEANGVRASNRLPNNLFTRGREKRRAKERTNNKEAIG